MARRTGLSVSAIRFYEVEGLVFPTRNSGGQRRFLRADIPRLSFILIAQQLGFSIQRIREALAGLPDHRTPTQRDWSRLARGFRDELQDRIDTLTRLRDRLDCVCLSLSQCAYYNADHLLRHPGAGPRYLMAGSVQADPG